MITVKNKVETLLQTVASESQHLRLSSDLSVRSMVHGCPHSHAHYTWRRKDSFEICMSIKPVFLPDSHWLPYSSSGFHHLSWFDVQFVNGFTRLAHSSSSQIRFSFLTGKWSRKCHILKDGTSRLWNITQH